MKVFVCLDEVGGMAFNKRRQSFDRVIRENMLQMVGEAKLLVNEYTAKQFSPEETKKLTVTEECLENAKENDYVFLENRGIAANILQVEEIIVYRWKRNYPADFFFDVELTNSDWELLAFEELIGYSHECIGKEIYRKVGK